MSRIERLKRWWCMRMHRHISGMLPGAVYICWECGRHFKIDLGPAQPRTTIIIVTPTQEDDPRLRELANRALLDDNGDETRV